MTISLNAALQLTESAAWTEREGRITVIDLDGVDATPFVIAGSAAAIWTELEERKTARAIVSSLAARYSVKETEISTEVLSFIEQLLERGLVSTVDVNREPR